MKLIYLVSTYKGNEKKERRGSAKRGMRATRYERFSFYGAYYGSLISKILLDTQKGNKFILDQKYLLKINVTKLNDKVLYGKVISYKNLPDESDLFIKN